MVNLNRLEEIKDLRTVWPHEALDFTPWLSQDNNISLLADAIGLDITVDETEACLYILPEGKIIIEHSAELSDQSKWQEQFDWLADVMVKIKRRLRNIFEEVTEWLH